MYVSITGLRVKGLLREPLFWWHAIPTVAQARSTPGVLFVGVRKVEGVQHTLTAWQDRAAMRLFLTSGAHLKAMQAFHRIGSGRTCGYETQTLPGWDEALAYWRLHGREYA